MSDDKFIPSIELAQEKTKEKEYFCIIPKIHHIKTKIKVSHLSDNHIEDRAHIFISP